MGYVPLSHNLNQKGSSLSPESSGQTAIDKTHAEEAHAFYKARPALQIAASCLRLIRGDYDSEYRKELASAHEANEVGPAYITWWSLYGHYDVYTAMEWFGERPDIRQGILTRLCNFPTKAGRSMQPDHQAGLIEMVIESGDRSMADFEAAIRPEDIVVYGPADDLFRQFAVSIPNETPTVGSRDHERTLHVFAGLLLLLLEGRLSQTTEAHPPILSYVDFRLALGLEDWHLHIPRESLVDLDKKRLILERRRPDVQFATRDEIRIIGLPLIVKSFPFAAIRRIFEVAAARVRFDPPRSSVRPPGKSVRPPASHAPTVRGAVSRPNAPVSRSASRLPMPPGVPRPEQAATLPSTESAKQPAPPERGPVTAIVLVSTPEPTLVGLKPPPSPSEAVSPPGGAPHSEAPVRPSVVPQPAQTDEVDGGWDGDVSDRQNTIPVPRDHPADGHPAVEPPKPDEEAGAVVIAGSEVGYIPNSSFDNAPDHTRKATVPPARASESTSDLRTLRMLIEIQTQYGLTFPEDGMHLPHQLTQDIYALLSSRVWLEDEKRMREVMVHVLHAVSPEEYPMNGIWSRISFPGLRDLFLATLKEVSQPLLRELATTLEEGVEASSA